LQEAFQLSKSAVNNFLKPVGSILRSKKRAKKYEFDTRLIKLRKNINFLRQKALNGRLFKGNENRIFYTILLKRRIYVQNTAN